MSSQAAPPKSAVAWIKTAPNGRPFVEGRRCRACGAVMVEERLACPACAGRDGFDTFEASPNGTLNAYSIVRRSFPGIEVPFVSAVIDLDDGLTLKGNLINAGHEPEGLPLGKPVRMVFADALGRTDKEGASYVSYFFEPA